jgi:hypothetical protein
MSYNGCRRLRPRSRYYPYTHTDLMLVGLLREEDEHEEERMERRHSATRWDDGGRPRANLDIGGIGGEESVMLV